MPDLLGEATSSWAMPCFPVAGPQAGFYTVPQVGAGVWVEFEQGDISFPIWVGCWYGSAGEVPAEALAGNPRQPPVVVRTPGGHLVLLSDLPGGPGITLRTASGAKIVVNIAGIEISNGQGASLTLTGHTVTINDGAFAISWAPRRGMPGYLLHVNATVMCPHGGQAICQPAQQRAAVTGLTAATIADFYAVTGCPFTVSGAPRPCVTVQWTTASETLRASGSLVLLQDSTGICRSAGGTPQGAATVAVVQQRAVGR